MRARIAGRRDSLAAPVWPEYQCVVGDACTEHISYRLRRTHDDNSEHPRYLPALAGLGDCFVLPE